MSKIFFYKLAADTNGAPCIDDGLLTLAICKPMIRSVANQGDLIFGFAGNSLHRDNRLIYIARVTGKLCEGKYYDATRFRNRGDCIYRRSGNRFFWRTGSLHHGPSHVIHDLGKPKHYPRANVLLSNDFRYFGGDGSAAYKLRYPHIKRAIQRLGRGHRVNHDPKLRSQLEALKERIWSEIKRKVAGKATSEPNQQICYRSRSCGIVSDS
jgi:hypothetical protein